MPFHSTKAEIVGEFDSLWRPLIELELVVAGRSHVMRSHIDTACDDALVFRSFERAVHYGLPFRTALSALRHERFLANGVAVSFVEAMVSVNWFGAIRVVRALAPDPNKPSELAFPEGLPLVLVGLPLLRETELGLRFDQSRSIKILNLGAAA